MSQDKMARWAAKAEALAKGMGDRNYWKEKPGANVIRIVPAKLPREDFWVEVKKSFSVGPNKKVVTRRDQFGLDDPLTKEIAKLNDAGDEASKKRAEAMKAKTRVMMFIIDRADEAKGVQMWDTNLLVLRDILAVCADSEYGDITDAEKGIDLTVNYTPKGNGPPKWNIIPKRHSSPLGHPEALEEDLFEKYSVTKPSEAEYIQACLDGTEQAWIESRKAEREAERAGADAPAAEEEESEAPAAPGSEDAAVAAELEKIRQRKAKKAPVKPSTPKALIDQNWWVVIDGKTVKKSGAEVQEIVNEHGKATVAPTSVKPVAWTDTTKAGFVAEDDEPPPPSQVGLDLEEALK